MAATRNSYTISMPSNMSPPSDLASYSRVMHLHTKRQMEAANMSSRRHERSSDAPVPSMPNGNSGNSSTSPSSSRGSRDSHEYHN
ncbi:hypothetical protein GGR57DRAFT_478865 [Xylariaceae sp. FL1272]|nr:hypothetical protein GGR57DRAFT_478865 [Xylariaceae sp. FL1272]